MNRQCEPVAATLTVRVPLGATGSLADGAVRIVERTDAVGTIATADVRRVSPGLNDTTVELRVRVALELPRGGEDVDALARRALAVGVGVESVADVERVESVEPEAPPPAEVG
ncbi:hypothetical protein [Natrinema salifodinae]|uniref:Uncharacterized protein n=1 Tax=Natrinema salifodinae TaxID=1202768 RepID=A0A1I0M1Q2_9EURY|nr:hypothetical protein [Natrinema salifodinae]SEV82367.1 hypothetical protein SAMN05216285_0343 [Natrinema salifodinae]